MTAMSETASMRFTVNIWITPRTSGHDGTKELGVHLVGEGDDDVQYLRSFGDPMDQLDRRVSGSDRFWSAFALATAEAIEQRLRSGSLSFGKTQADRQTAIEVAVSPQSVARLVRSDRDLPPLKEHETIHTFSGVVPVR